MKTHKCWCNDPGNCVIDENSHKKYCGVKGLVDLNNVKVSNKKVICLHCNNIIYKEK